MAEPGKGDVLFELGVKAQQFEKALTLALEISFETVVTNQAPVAGRSGPPEGEMARAMRMFMGGGPTFTIGIPGQSFGVDAQLFNQSPEPLTVESVDVAASDGKNWSIHPVGEPVHEIAGGKDAQWRFAVTAPADAALTRPYFTRPNEEQAYYDLIDERYRNLPFAPYPLTARARVTYRGVGFEVQQAVQTSERVPGIGTLLNPLLVGPAISVAVSPSAGAVPIEFQIVRIFLHCSQQRKGSRAGPASAEAAAGLAIDARRCAFLLSPRWRR